MNVEGLFNGIAVIIDDEVNTVGTQIATIRNLIEEKNIPVVAYEDIPQQEIIPSLMNAAFVILDWDYINDTKITENEERITGLNTLKELQEEKLIDFIKALINSVFLPVFIFTFKAPESIIERLSEANLWYDTKQNRIFVKQKNEITSEEHLFGAMEEWLKVMPSVYVLKEWEHIISTTKNKMFLELYDYSPNWVKIIWDMLKEDSIENHNEFGAFVTRNLINRINGYTFDESIINAHQNILPEELRRVIEGERYLEYEVLPAQAYTGDLFKDGNKYYLNIRAQCDLARTDNNGNYNPTLYCIKGEILKSSDITTEVVRMTSEGHLAFGNNKFYSLEDLREICQDENKLPVLNKEFEKHRNKVFFRKGTLLERNDKVIIGCIAGEKAIQFKLEIQPKEFSSIQDKRIGRVLSPYITQVQQKCSQNMIREGILPMPKELFYNFDC